MKARTVTGKTKTHTVPFVGVPETIRRLQALRLGQSIVFYRGDHQDNVVTPLYNDLVHSIFACANQLEREGRVTLSKRELKLSERFYMTEHVATGRG
jgi:hypothetical protein